MRPADAKDPPGQWRLLLPALLAWAAAAWAVGHPGSGRMIAWTAGACGVLLLLCAVRAPRTPRVVSRARAALRLLALGCAVLVLVGARIDGEEFVRADPELRTAAETGAPLEARARLSSFPAAQSDGAEGAQPRSWVRADVETRRGEVPVLLWLDGAPRAGWAPGTRVEILGTPKALEAGSNAAYGVPVRSIQTAPPTGPSVGEVAAGLRDGLRGAAARVPGAELVPGFAVGDTALVTRELEADMLETSLTHLTAVSGANCALVIGAVVAVASRLGAGKRLRAVLASTGLLGFVAVVGPDPSVQRAAVMAGVVLLSGFGGKKGLALPSLGIAVLGLLLADPWQSRQAGFVLSVAATAGILLLVPAVRGFLRRRARLPDPLAVPLAVVLAAQFSCAPFLLLLQPGLPIVGVAANLIAAPAAPLGTGLGLLAMLLLPFSAELGARTTSLASLPARWVAATAEATSDIPFGRWHWPEGWAGALLLAACQAALLLAYGLASGRLTFGRFLERPPPLPWERRPGGRGAPVPSSGGPESAEWDGTRPRADGRGVADRRLRRVVSLLLCGSAGVVASVTLVAPATDLATTPRAWAAVACDVGQGDAMLIRDPRHPDEVVLVDTGDDPDRLEACLRRFGVDRIALLVLSHDDADHVGALESIVERVDEAIVAPPSAEQIGDGDPPDRQVIRTLDTRAVPTLIGAAGDRGALGGLRWEAIAPREGARPASTNAASLVMRIEIPGFSVLLLGDTGEDEQRGLLGAPSAMLRADVVKVAHHGSRDQHPALYGAVGAELGLISVGADNGYGHPTADALRMLADAGTRPIRTDEHGSVAVSRRGGELSVWVERAEASNERR